jgi:hypothetical protein
MDHHLLLAWISVVMFLSNSFDLSIVCDVQLVPGVEGIGTTVSNPVGTYPKKKKKRLIDFQKIKIRFHCLFFF